MSEASWRTTNCADEQHTLSGCLIDCVEGAAILELIKCRMLQGDVETARGGRVEAPAELADRWIVMRCARAIAAMFREPGRRIAIQLNKTEHNCPPENRPSTHSQTGMAMRPNRRRPDP